MPSSKRFRVPKRKQAEVGMLLQSSSTSVVAAITLLFTFMAAICQRLMGQAFGLAQPAGRTASR